jgi:Zn-dependent protease with chaperone function
MALPSEGFQLTDISPKAYEHPADAAATAALASVPMLDQVVRKLIEFGYERGLRAAYLGASVRLGHDQLPEIYRLYKQVLITLDMPEEYDLYVTQMPVANAMAIGSGRPIIVLNSGLVNLGDEETLKVAMAHECAHILSDHMLYRTALQILLRLSVPRLPFLAGVPVLAIKYALLEWSRATELSADRASALVMRDPLPVCRTLMRITAGAAADKLSLDAYLAQAADYNEGGQGFDKITRIWQDLGVTHARPVKRVREVMEWVRTGDFNRIVDGEYPRRGDPVDVRQHTDEAVDHYSERFRNVTRDAGDSLANVADSLADWLRRDPPSDDDV